MSRKSLGLIAVWMAVLPILSCATGQRLVSVSVTPNPVVFEGVGAQVQFTAIGTFEHPPSTKNITDQVTWSIDVENLATITSTGFVTAINICGKGNVIATANATLANAPPGTVMQGSASIQGIDDGTAKCMP
jgi:Bacterial Ig-like domain (group 2)